MPEFKSVPQHIKAVEDRKVTGIFSVFGNRDSYDDRMFPGAFTKTFQERAKQAKFLWNHDFFSPPIAVITSLREVPRDELPPEVLQMAPDALGGAEVVREYLPTPRGDEVLAGIKAGAVTEMSFGFDPVKFDFETWNDVRLRNIREVKLYDVSDVLWGANDATVAAKLHMPIDLLLKHLDAHLRQVKAGARNSGADMQLINTIHRAALELGCTECKGLIEGEGEKAAVPALDLLRARLGLLVLT